MNDDRLIPVRQLKQLENHANHAHWIQIRKSRILHVGVPLLRADPDQLFPGMTSSSNDLLLARPTFNGITVPGNTTILRMGNIGKTCGNTVRCPLVPVRMVVLVGVRSMMRESDISCQLLVASCQLPVKTHSRNCREVAACEGSQTLPCSHLLATGN